MGILISLIVLPIQAIQKRRRKQKAEKIALNYTTTGTAPSTQSQSQSRRPDSQQQQEVVSAPQQSSEPIPGQQQQQRIEKFNPTLGAARAGYPVPTAGTTPGAAAGTTTTLEKSTPRAAAEQDTMASDEDYMAFLDKANQDPGVGYSAMGQKTGGKVQLKTMDAGATVPEELRMATEREEWVYVSDADEPFVAVSLNLKGETLPDEETFAKMINHPGPSNADIEILDPVKWDSKGQYKNVVDATRKACMGGDVRVYKVALGGTRVEYWVVGVDATGKNKEAKLVGVKALAVES